MTPTQTMTAREQRIAELVTARKRLDWRIRQIAVPQATREHIERAVTYHPPLEELRDYYARINGDTEEVTRARKEALASAETHPYRRAA